MSEKIRGFVKKLATKSGNSRGRDWTAYSARLEDKEGNELPKWFRFGFENPNLKEGDYIEVGCEEINDKFIKVASGSVRVSKNPPTRSASANASSGSSGDRGSSYNSDVSRNDRNYHAARASAIEMVSVLLSHGGLPITEAKSKKGMADRYNQITAAVDKLTVQYFLDEVAEADSRFRVFETVADSRNGGTADVDPLPDDTKKEGASSDDGFPEEEPDEDGF